jgi:hypothetical protein
VGHALRSLPLLEGLALPEPIRVPSRPRGHGPKIAEAMRGLEAAGQLPANLRLVEIERRIRDWLLAAGYARGELPNRWAVSRFLKARARISGLMN